MNAAEAMVFMFSRHIHNTEHGAEEFCRCSEESCREAREALSGRASSEAVTS